MILVVSNEDDDHSRLVLARLRSAGVPAAQLDLARFPQELRLSLTCATGEVPSAVLVSNEGGERIELKDCRVVWWRRPQPLQVDPRIGDPDHRSFAYAESHAAISGLWPLLEAFWINDPERDEVSSHKSFQLEVARELGFEIPATLITNDPERAREFVADHGTETVYKAFSGTVQAWRETRLLREDEVDLLDAVALAPVIFQEYVPAALDLRVTMIDGSAFAAAIHSQETPYKVDYRMHMDDARVEPFALPDVIQSRLRELMQRLGLVYGAIDLRLSPDGRFHFLEINPSGQWLFVEERTELPMTDAFVRLLIESDRTP